MYHDPSSGSAACPVARRLHGMPPILPLRVGGCRCLCRDGKKRAEGRRAMPDPLPQPDSAPNPPPAAPPTPERPRQPRSRDEFTDARRGGVTRCYTALARRWSALAWSTRVLLVCAASFILLMAMPGPRFGYDVTDRHPRRWRKRGAGSTTTVRSWGCLDEGKPTPRPLVARNGDEGPWGVRGRQQFGLFGKRQRTGRGHR